MRDDAKIIGDGIAPRAPLFRQHFSEEPVDCLGELGESRVEFVVRDLAVHDAPQSLDGVEMRRVGGEEVQLDPALRSGQPLWVDVNSLSVRSGPGTTYDQIGSLTRGSEIDVTGKAAESNWYRFKMDDGATGFVFGKYLAPEAPRKKDRVVQPTPEPNSEVLPGNRTVT